MIAQDHIRKQAFIPSTNVGQSNTNYYDSQHNMLRGSLNFEGEESLQAFSYELPPCNFLNAI